MSCSNRPAGFGARFPTLAGLTAPAQEVLTREPAFRSSGLRIRASLERRLRTLLQAFEQRRERARIRRILAGLDDRLLRDIGLSRAAVGPELPAPFPGLGEPLAPARDAARGQSLGQARHGLWHL